MVDQSMEAGELDRRNPTEVAMDLHWSSPPLDRRPFGSSLPNVYYQTRMKALGLTLTEHLLRPSSPAREEH